MEKYYNEVRKNGGSIVNYKRSDEDWNGKVRVSAILGIEKIDSEI